MSGAFVSIPTGKQIEPKGCCSFFRPESGSGHWKNRSPTLHHVTHLQNAAWKSLTSFKVENLRRTTLWLFGFQCPSFGKHSFPPSGRAKSLKLLKRTKLAKATYPGKVKMGLIMPPNSIVDHLQFFSSFHRKPGHIFDSSGHIRDMLVLFILQPGRFADSVLSCFQRTCLRILNSCSSKLEIINFFRQQNWQ